MDSSLKPIDALRRIDEYRCIECGHTNCKKPQMVTVERAISKLREIVESKESDAHDKLPELISEMKDVRPCHELSGYVPPRTLLDKPTK
ncbi:hypothetical protein OYT1_ch1079 [Ferriphaselus amnicola]|uniref:Uncharacterized protein n=1 Tax=Ferriphaselus amnicola TaxID=1188319 RepID=A0A2Z6GB87_9PROT|nr:hypothetical protein OYT1_ch1079 [Ferriphaselus amnicola]